MTWGKDPEDMDTLEEIFHEQNPSPPPPRWPKYRTPLEPRWWEDPHKVAAMCTTMIIVTLVGGGCLLFIGWVAYVMAKLNGQM